MDLNRSRATLFFCCTLVAVCAAATDTQYVDCPFVPTPEPKEDNDGISLTRAVPVSTTSSVSVTHADAIASAVQVSAASTAPAKPLDARTSTVVPSSSLLRRSSASASSSSETAATSSTVEPVTPSTSFRTSGQPRPSGAGNIAKVDFVSSSLDSTTPRNPSWRDHPVYQASPKSIIPPILVWYTTRADRKAPWRVSGRGRYTRQGSGWTLLGDEYATPKQKHQFHLYDLLQLSGTQGQAIRRYLEFETTRKSTMCLVMNVQDVGNELRGRNGKMRPPPGYRGFGRAAWDNEKFEQHRNQDHASYVGFPVDYAYIACKTLPAGIHRMTSAELLRAQHKVNTYNIIFGEVDGSIPQLTSMPPGWTGPKIEEHKQCPDQLHDLWSVDSHDPNDPDIAGKKWKTWHPQKDYLYGCYYGHEHGTPGMLAGYTERFHYTAWKNYRQDEAHAGFKSYVFPHGDKRIFLNIHADTTDIGRVNTRHHTVVIAVNDKSGKNLYEMSCKADFGGSFATLKKPLRFTHDQRVLPVGDENSRKLINYFLFNDSNRLSPRPRKRVNVFNIKNLDPRLLYKRRSDGKLLGRGQYEVWTGGASEGAYCMTVDKPSDGIQVDIKNAETACKHASCTETAYLGENSAAGFRRNLGTNRALVFRKVRISPKLCPFDLPAPGDDGYIRFYTNPYCKALCDGPGPHCVLQKIHSSFSGILLNNVYEVSDIHGFNKYEKQYKQPWNGVMGNTLKHSLTGIGQIENSLTI